MGTRPHPAGESAPAARLRRATLLLLLFAACFSLSSLVWQWIRWGGFAREELGEFARLLPVFWSPYLALAALALWLGRRPLTAATVRAGSCLIVLWGVYWHLDILVLRPSTMSQILSPLLIPGNQWLAVICTAGLAIAVGLAVRLKARPTRDDLQH